MATRTLAVVTAGLGRPSSTRLLADRLTTATTEALRERGDDLTVEIVELRDLAHDLANNLLTGFPAGALRGAVEAVAGADGLIAVSPIFNASYSGLFKTFFDVLEQGSLAGKPVLIGATGGTPRHSLALEHALRPMFAYMRSIVVPTAVYAASEDWGAEGGLAERINLAGRELAELMASRTPAERTDPYDKPISFEDLLSGGSS